MRDGEGSPRERRFREREREILRNAIELAESEGWDAVTTRRLAEAINYSQPVIYQHFANRDDLIRTIVLEGFKDLTKAIEGVKRRTSTAPLEDVCRAYIDFGKDHPRLYEAMFTNTTLLPFASGDTPPEMREAFGALSSLIEREAPGIDAESGAELFWACCHGLVTLRSSGRIPPERFECHIRAVAQIVH